MLHVKKKEKGKDKKGHKDMGWLFEAYTTVERKTRWLLKEHPVLANKCVPEQYRIH